MSGKPLVQKVLEKDRKHARDREGMGMLNVLSGLSRVPLVGRLHPWTRTDLTDMRWLPINEDIELPESMPAPPALLDRLIEEASHRVVFDACACRTSFGCSRHPVDIGCLLMGDSATESPSSVSREVGVAEAKEHAARAVEAGLVPMVGKARIDNYIFGIKDRLRLLTACFCCDCCCISRMERLVDVKRLDEMFPRIDGISVEITAACDGCGECAERCYVRAIKIRDGKAVIGSRCRACGRCATVCPPRALRFRIDDELFLEKSYDRIRSHVTHD